ncbi:MAG: 23S rRNA (guanosine(2251)-2'-O)-methyltransferase RlmB [Bacillota bacterium]|nr:23S rRNA (guanosine(2251)-2'-O)-methyltransferase RlmB [Bacillota bacterium]MDD3297765.1 23S rRNA (guanosine(2251)-2'-O)-methyltransferase RlmB [Bacillota bacterium]MDD3851935.1 23S rRNA (guanosine(2251)-2'-O)-methyltransferase RlmB [Bacillota bacterium]MDD4706662.1 23S rRNA (guanosine(2251)-2'-O)-methyltransferase RlmB [Bacillota bacterium]
MDGNGIVRGRDTVEGRNPVSELLRTQRKVEGILAAKGLDPSGRRIIDRARELGIGVEYVDRRRLDKVSRTGAHQGIIALVEEFRYAEGPKTIIEKARAMGQVPLVVVLDRVSDPHNLGAVIRTAHCCGVHGVIIPERNAAGVTPTAVKAAAGAAGYIPVAQVTNTVRALERMKDMGLWIAGADMDGEIMYKADLKGPLALVAGSEGKGLGRLVREKCDFLVSVPMKGVLSSLNVSVATGVLLYEVLRQREYQ